MECLKQQQLMITSCNSSSSFSTSLVFSPSVLRLLSISFHLRVYILHFSSPSIAKQHPRKCSESRVSFGFRPNYSVTGDKSLPRVEYVWSPSKWCGKIKVNKLTMSHLHRGFSRMTGVTYTAQMRWYVGLSSAAGNIHSLKKELKVLWLLIVLKQTAAEMKLYAING